MLEPVCWPAVGELHLGHPKPECPLFAPRTEKQSLHCRPIAAGARTSWVGSIMNSGDSLNYLLISME